MLQGTFLFWNNCSFLYEVSSFVVIAPGQCVVIRSAKVLSSSRPQYCPKTFTFHMQRASEGKRQWREERNFTISQILQFLFRFLGHLNFYITATTFMWSHFRKSPRPHSAGWRHRWLHIEETYKVENTPKTRFACTCMILTVISGFIIKRHYIFLPLKCAGLIEKNLETLSYIQKKYLY